MKVKLFGSILFITGLASFVLGLIFLDLASLSLKDDIYTLTVLATFNNFFSLKPPFVIFQTVLSSIFIIVSCLLVFKGVILIRKRKDNG
tara:strand:+ start:100 stop:366 length:267 start_codon:yes stop_codon:yes gene_type:complete